MKRFIVERDMPGAGNLTEEELQAMAKTSNSVIAVLGKPYNWIYSYVTGNKIYCIHEAESEDVIREHSNCASFPITKIEEVKKIIKAETAL